MLRKNVKSLLEQLQVCIFAEIVFGVRCTLRCSSGNKGKVIVTERAQIKEKMVEGIAKRAREDSDKQTGMVDDFKDFLKGKGQCS